MATVLSSAAIKEVQALLKSHGVTSCVMFYEGGAEPRELESSMMLMVDSDITKGNETGDILYMYAITVGATVIGRENAHKLIDNIDDIKLGDQQFLIDNEN